MVNTESVKVGIVGAGAVTEVHHLPAARLCPDVEVVAIGDKNLDRARSLARRFGIPRATADHRDLFGRVDGAIVAVPNYLHAPVAIEFLERRIPALVEKPMALNADEATRMIRTAKAGGVVLQAGHMLRFAHGARLVKRLVAEGWCGKLLSFSLESGFVFDWPTVSGFVFDRQQAGGGVLIDLGSHMLDLLLWWLGDDVDLVEYRDDSMGGVEAECQVSLVARSATGPAPGDVTLSRLRRLSGTAVIRGERCAIEYRFGAPHTARIVPPWDGGRAQSFVSDSAALPRSSRNFYAEQLRAFARAIAAGGESAVPGESALRSIALMERCYRERRPLELPWMAPGGAAVRELAQT